MLRHLIVAAGLTVGAGICAACVYLLQTGRFS